MKILPNHTTNFGAKFIGNVEIKKYNPELDKYFHNKASFIEIEPENCMDILALDNSIRHWDYDLYGANVAYMAFLMMGNKELYSNKRIYALTTQENNLDKLDDEKIVGMAEVTEFDNNSVELDNIQAKPFSVQTNYKKPFQLVGTKMLNSLKKIYSNKTIELFSRAGNTTQFYKKNGFICLDKSLNRYAWNVNAKLVH